MIGRFIRDDIEGPVVSVANPLPMKVTATWEHSKAELIADVSLIRPNTASLTIAFDSESELRDERIRIHFDDLDSVDLLIPVDKFSEGVDVFPLSDVKE